MNTVTVSDSGLDESTARISGTMIGLCLFLPYPAPPLTLDAVLEAVKGVRSWRELAEGLMGWYSWRDEDKKKLAAIQRQHVSDEACLKAVVEAFLLGEGKYQPSWRSVIHALHKAGKSHLAEKIKTNAEPQQGELAQQYTLAYPGICVGGCWTVCVRKILQPRPFSSTTPTNFKQSCPF